MEGPFLGSEALTSGGVTRRELGRSFRRLYPNVYMPPGVALTASSCARAAWVWSDRQGVVAGLSASALLGSKWISPNAPAELIVGRRHAPALITLHRDQLLVGESIGVQGIPATTAARTAFDIGRRMSFTQALIHLDALFRAAGLTGDDVLAVANMHKGARGVLQLRELVTWVDGGAESPQETRTRLVLVRGGLPAPQTQIEVIDEFGWVFARIDMGWEEWKVGVEFDGAQHWTDPAQRTKDIERLAELQSLGWRIIRVSSDMLRRPPTIVDRVADAVRAAGWRGERTSRRKGRAPAAFGRGPLTLCGWVLSPAGYGEPHGGPSGDTTGENGSHTGDSTNVARHLLTPDPHWLSPSQPLMETLILVCCSRDLREPSQPRVRPLLTRRAPYPGVQGEVR